MKSRTLLWCSLFVVAMSVLWSACSYQPFRQGEILYGNFCATCHGEKGEGFRDLYPPVANSDYFQQNQLEAACIIYYGMDKEIEVNGKPYQQAMLAISQLNAVEICNIINFLSYNWNPGMEPLTIDQVKAQIESCSDWERLK